MYSYLDHRSGFVVVQFHIKDAGKWFQINLFWHSKRFKPGIQELEVLYDSRRHKNT